jgi:hypothetical protein
MCRPKYHHIGRTVDWIMIVVQSPILRLAIVYHNYRMTIDPEVVPCIESSAHTH